MFYLDVAVKISAIATPLVLAIAGWFITNAINKRSHVAKLKSDLHLEWSKKFINKCFDYSDFITLLQMKIWDFAQQNLLLISLQGNSNETKMKHEQAKLDDIASELKDYTFTAKKIKYEIDVYSEFVDGSDNCTKQVNAAFEFMSNTYKELEQENSNIDFESLKTVQKELLKELRLLQDKVLEIKI